MKPVLVATAVLSLVLAGCGAKPEIAASGEQEKEPVVKEEANLAPPEDEPTQSEEEPTPELALYGNYEGTIEFPEGFFEDQRSKAESEGVPKEKIDEFESGLKNSKMSLQLKPEGTYIVSSDSMGTSDTRSGKWNYDADAKVLTMEPPQGDIEAKEKVFIVRDKGRRLLFVGDIDGVKVTITFVRV